MVKKNTTNQYSHTGLNANSKHTYRIKATNLVGQSNWSAMITANTLSSNSGQQGWQANKNYKTGEVVSYGGKNYKCRQPHSTIAGWEPPNVPALWEQVPS